MAEYSAKERMVAAMLSSMPGLKRWGKKVYVMFNAIIYKKDYKIKILCPEIDNVNTVVPEARHDEIFFGYYDKCCCQQGKVIYHQTDYSSVHIPNPKKPAKILLKDINSKEVKTIGETFAYNWQQGSRLHWIDNTRLLYNVYNEQKRIYQCVMYDTSTNTETRRYNKPVQESFHDDFYLSINYRRLWSMRPDYCYRCLPIMSKEELADMDNDGIWRIDMRTGDIIMVHSIADVLKVEYREQFVRCDHNVNHVMLSPDGKRFIFIHRNYEGKRRYDRLMISDFKTLRVVIDEKYVSHCCWIDNHTILGYLMSGGKRGFYFIDVDTLEVKCCEKMTALQTGDGHPSFNGRFVAFDTYPDKSRMQKLYLYDMEKDTVTPLVELFQSTKYEEETRCDLHPRFSNDGKWLFFDTVYSGHRELCWVDLCNFIK